MTTAGNETTVTVFYILFSIYGKSNDVHCHHIWSRASVGRLSFSCLLEGCRRVHILGEKHHTTVMSLFLIVCMFGIY